MLLSLTTCLLTSPCFFAHSMTCARDSRTVRSSVASMGSAAPLSLEDDDPLLRRFKELERDQ